MNPFFDLGKMLIFFGGLLVVIGLVIVVLPKPPFLGRLPGDISLHRGNFHFYFPLGTCILVSIVLSLILWILKR